jgi:hypothetical protein
MKQENIISTTNETDRHDIYIAKILLKVTLNICNFIECNSLKSQNTTTKGT